MKMVMGVSDRVVCLRGRIAADGTPAEISATEALRAYLGRRYRRAVG
jgi:ABC-type branched-subunit amino acid transport system ATPase component